MDEKEKYSNRQHIYSLYRRIKNSKDGNGAIMCCEEWRSNRQSFYTWYENRVSEQQECCQYCHLPGDTMEYYRKRFRKGRRGFNLEVDRKDAKSMYSPDNCVLACYPCNNAKSDVFSYKDFLKIGEAIGKVKKSTL